MLEIPLVYRKLGSWWGMVFLWHWLLLKWSTDEKVFSVVDLLDINEYNLSRVYDNINMN